MPGPFKCTFKGCNESYEKESHLRRHKKQNADHHNYCKKCDLMFETWDELVCHKAQLPDHLSCKFCGRDFHCWDGLALHVKCEHPAKQKVKCIGCGQVFDRASHMIGHIEEGRCGEISAQEFSSALMQKQIVNNILKHPETFSNIVETKTLMPRGSESNGNDVCDVRLNLMDATNTDLGSIYGTLEPEKENIDLETPREKEWPALDAKPAGSVKLSSLALHLNNIVLEEASKKAESSSVTSSPRHTASSIHVADESKTVWGKGKSSASALFPNAAQTPLNHRINTGLELSNQLSLLDTRFWDPTSQAYDPDNFWHPLIEAYVCPFKGCDVQYRVPFDLKTHLLQSHKLTHIRCPKCQKEFTTARAIVRHCENPLGKCRIAESGDFGEALDIFSGGFLEVRSDIREDFRTLTVDKNDAKASETSIPGSLVKPSSREEQNNEKETGDSKGQLTVTRTETIHLPDKIIPRWTFDQRTLEYRKVWDQRHLKYDAYRSSKSPYWETGDKVTDTRGFSIVPRGQERTGPKDPHKNIGAAKGREDPKSSQRMWQNFSRKNAKKDEQRPGVGE